MANAAKAVAAVLVGAAPVYLLLAGGLRSEPEDDIKTVVAQNLRDPSSAEFRNIRIGRGTSCGEVNGKNGFGAYSGFSDFVVKNGIVLFEPQEPIAPTVQSQTAFFEQQSRFARLSQECYE